MACKFAHQLKGGIGVVDVVVAQFLALMLGCGRNPRTGRAIGIKGSALMRVLAVAQRLRKRPAKGAPPRCAANLRGHPGADGGVIGGRAGVGGLGQPLAQGIWRLTVVRAQLRQNGVIVFDVHDDGHKPMVLGGRPDHRRSADVDVFDHFGIVRALGHRFLKRIEVHDHQIDWRDVVRVHRCDMVFIVAQGQQAAMDNRVQGLDPAIHHLGKAGDLGHILDGKARRAQRLGGSTCAEQLDPVACQRRGKLHQSGFVGYGKKRAAQRGKVGHLAAILLVWNDTGFVPVEIADAHGSFLRLGQGPANTRRVIHNLTSQHDLQCGARFQAHFFQIDAAINGKAVGPIVAEYPDLTAFECNPYRHPIRVEFRVHFGVQMEANVKRYACQQLGAHHLVEQAFFMHLHGKQHVLSRQGAPIKCQIKGPCMCQAMGSGITIVPALET